LLPTAFCALGAVAGIAADAPEQAAPSNRPNILWITCEDMSPLLGCYGDAFAVTPNLDRLAQEGVRYTRAFASASVCTPARSSLITGVFASSLGTQHLRGPAPLPKTIRCFTEYLREAGYYCTNNVKEDYNFTTPKTAWDESSGKAHWRSRKPSQPFFAVFNLTCTHQGQIRYSAEQFAKINAQLPAAVRRDPARVPLPPYYPDTPIVRRNLAQLYTQVMKMDGQVQDLLDQLEEDGLAENTIVFFYSDHGTALPRGKRWLYDSGIQVPMIVRFPEKYQQLAPGKPGTTTGRLVSFIDFPPTVLSLLGLEIPEYMQGSAFLGVQAGEPRQHVFAIRDRVDEVGEFSRAVRDARYKYIRNYMPHRPAMQSSNYSEQTPIRQELRRLDAAGQLDGPQRVLLARNKPAEELYDVQADPYELNNLAGSAEHRDTLERLRTALRQWMIDTRDTGLLPEAEMHRRAEGGSPYVMARTPDAFRIERVLDAAELVGKGPDQREQLIALLADSDPAVRYWAATGLAALGKDARPAEAALRRALKDPSLNVRLAAAEVLCRLGQEAVALPVLVAGLKHGNPAVRLHAAMSMVAIGERTRGALDEVKQAAADKSPGNLALYARWALGHVLREVRP